MNIHQTPYRAIWRDGQSICWIDQTKLPHQFEILTSNQPEALVVAITTMQVRGAPTIGATAAYGLALAFAVEPARFADYWLPRFAATRPTAVNLFHACAAMRRAAAEPNQTAKRMFDLADEYADAEVACNRAMGLHLAERLAVGQRRIGTHCNAGWLAAVDWGTATSGIYQLQQAGESPFVWVDETRPRLQGARLTAWELSQAGVACRLQCDNSAAYRMARGEVDAIVVGADRIAANGDVANKIGTYMLALAAKAHGVPFYVAAPKSTFDAACPTGGDIVIEERSTNEVLWIEGVGRDGAMHEVLVSAPGIVAINPAFDVTPFGLVTAIIHEDGVWQPK